MKKIQLVLSAAAIAMAMGTTAYAGEWKSDNTGWWYDLGDGSYCQNGWQWIDGDQDGVAESYYFDANGYCLTDTTTPDGYTVNASGAWTIDGVVQTQAAASEPESAPAAQPAAQEAPAATETVYVPATGEKYHRIPNCGRMNPDKARAISISEAISLGYKPCEKCY